MKIKGKMVCVYELHTITYILLFEEKFTSNGTEKKKKFQAVKLAKRNQGAASQILNFS